MKIHEGGRKKKKKKGADAAIASRSRESGIWMLGRPRRMLDRPSLY